MIVRRIEFLSLLGLVVVVAMVCLRTASVRPLWYDERFTQYLSRYEHLEQLATNLSLGADLNPPVSYILVRQAVNWFGESAITLRLPSLLGGLVAMFGTFYFVRFRRGSAEAFLAAALMAASEHVTQYFTEARPYGLMLGWTALVLLFWQRAASTNRSNLLPGFLMAASATAGMATHYYFAVPLVAIGLAEIVRTFELRRINSIVLSGFLAPVAVLALMRPLWQGPQNAYAAGFWAKFKPSLHEIANVYSCFSDSLLLTAFVFALLVTVFFSPSSRTEASRRGYSFAELAAIVSLALVPVIAFGLSAVITKVYVPRYCISFVVGLAAILGFVLGETAGRRPGVMMMLAVMFTGLGAFVQCRWTYEREHARRDRIAQTIAECNTAAAGQSIIIEMATPDRIDFALADGSIDYRPLLLTDVQLARVNEGQDTVDRGTQSLATFAGIPLLSFDQAIREVTNGWPLYYLGSAQHWRAKTLADRGVDFIPVRSIGDHGLTLYRMKARR
jgi:uncharacterized membrane protein